MEINGANSEPAHIYDPSTSLYNAYYELFKHWNIIYRISRYNHQKGVRYLNLVQAVRQIIRHLQAHRHDF